MAALNLDAMWDFSDPAASEKRFRGALAATQGQADDALTLRTQIARTFSLRQRFDEAHAELDALQPQLAQAGAEPRVRALLERGRTWRSSGQPERARPLFQQAFDLADKAQLQSLAGDALHMLALVEPSLDERIRWNQRTAQYANASADPGAQRWAAVALNNLGSDLRDAQRLPQSLAAFQEALAAYERSGRAPAVRVARWQVANVLRLMGRAQEALEMQLALERDCEAAGAPDSYVFDELALLYAARGEAERAQHYRSARALLEKRP